MDIKVNDFEKFVDSVRGLLVKEKLMDDERFRRGEKYNIFQVMGMESDEVNTHSAVLANLLDPRGSHGCGDKFLKSFLAQVPGLNDFDFPTSKAIVEVEYVIGPISDDEGGRIDILILSEDKLKGIIIENKIYASDQARQLFRYYRYAEKNLSDYRLLYLTLDGKEPSIDSITNRAKSEKLRGDGENSQPDYYCISYANDIMRWLEFCADESLDRPALRETLTQYIYLLKKLTHQNMESKTKHELAEVCTRPENIESLLWVHRNFDSIIGEIMNDTFVPQLEELAKAKGFGPVFVKDKDWLNTMYMRFAFKKADWKTFEICFEFQTRNMCRMVSGYRYQDGRRDSEVSSYNALSQIDARGKKSEGWPFFRYCTDQNWLSEKGFAKILNGDLISEIENEVDFYLQAIPNGVKM